MNVGVPAIESFAAPRKVVHFVARGSSTRRIVDGEGTTAICGATIGDPVSTEGRDEQQLVPCEDCIHIYDQLEP